MPMKLFEELDVNEIVLGYWGQLHPMKMLYLLKLFDGMIGTS